MSAALAHEAADNIVSLDFESYVQGGLVTDVDVEILSLRFTDEPPPNYQGGKYPSMFVKGILRHIDTGDEFDQWWSCGQLGDYEFVDEGRRISSPSKAPLKKGSNWHYLHESLTKLGLPKGALVTDKGLGALDGTKIHVIQQTVEREGLERKDTKYPPQVLVAQRLISWPWDPKGTRRPAPARSAQPARAAQPTAQSTAAPAAAAPAAAAADDAEVDVLALETLGKVLDADPVIELPTAKVQVFKALPSTVKGPIRAAVTARMSDVAWLQNNGFQVVDGSVMRA